MFGFDFVDKDVVRRMERIGVWIVIMRLVYSISNYSILFKNYVFLDGSVLK